jgi:hypothetical protein
MPIAVPDVAPILEQLRAELRAEFATELAKALRPRDARIAALEQRRPLSRRDREELARILPAVAGAYGSDWRLTREFVSVDAPAAVRVACGGLSAKRIGCLFRRAEGAIIDGYVVRRAGAEGHRVLWQVLAAVGSGVSNG